MFKLLSVMKLEEIRVNDKIVIELPKEECPMFSYDRFIVGTVTHIDGPRIHFKKPADLLTEIPKTLNDYNKLDMFTKTDYTTVEHIKKLVFTE